jgi:RES domain-containing protein
VTRGAVQRLDRTLGCFRIGDPHGTFPIYDSRGAELFPGRWNVAEVAVIYASEHYSTTMLEILANSNGVLPPNQHYIAITVPRGTSYEIVTKDHLSGWDARLPAVSCAFGAHWVREARSAVLLVPSYVARIERNVVINPAHADAKGIEISLPEPVWWDERLFDPSDAPKRPPGRGSSPRLRGRPRRAATRRAPPW